MAVAEQAEVCSVPTTSTRRQRVRSLVGALFRDRAVQQSVAVVVGLRIGLGLIAWGAVEALPITSFGGDFHELITPNSDFLNGVVAPWQRWDALWYQHIATSGYTNGGVDAAFFPLYPGLEHVVGIIFGGSFAIAGLVISTVAMVVALVLLHRLVAGDIDRPTADRSLMYIALAPAALFFFAPFSESLFLALSIGCLLAARRRRWWLAAVCGALVGLCRIQGVLLLVPLVVEAISDARNRRARGERGFRFAQLAAFTPGVTMAMYVGLAWQTLGTSPLTAMNTKWGQHFAAPWTAIADSVSTVIDGTHAEEPLNLVTALVAIAALPLMVRRLPWSYVAYAAVMIVPLCFREAFFSPLESTARYAAVDVPLFVLLAVAGRRMWVDRMVLTIFPVVLTFNLVLFSTSHFVG
jgi:mannosyltransferase PIG-V